MVRAVATAACSGYPEALWTQGIAPLLAKYHPGRVVNSKQFVESFCPYADARLDDAPTLNTAVELCFKANFSAEAAPSDASQPRTSQQWFYQQLLPRIVEWAGEFATVFTPVSLTAMAQPVNSEQEMEWVESGAIPTVDIPVYTLPLLNTIGRAPGASEATTRVTLTRRQCRSVLALALLGIEPRPFRSTIKRPFADGRPSEVFLTAGSDTEVCEVGSMSWYALYRHGNMGVGAQRLACMLQYFESWRAAEVAAADNLPALDSLDDPIEFIRSANCATSRPPDFSLVDDVFIFEPASMPGAPSPSILIDPRFMEAFADAEAHVDFANEQIHIGHIIPSCTQEEVMFSIRPELFLTLPLYTTLLPHEAAVVKGAASYVSYTGYRKTFAFAGPHAGGAEHPLSGVNRALAAANSVVARRLVNEVIIIDAHVNDGRQFGAAMHVRDVEKAFRGFQASDALVIGTGPWGCGVFAGDFTLKLLQQAIAAALCTPRRRLHYHAEQRQVAFFTALSAAMAACNVTVGTAYRWVSEFDAIHQRIRRGQAIGLPYDYDKVKRAYENGEWPSLADTEPGEASSVIQRRAAALAGWDVLHREAEAGVDISEFSHFVVCKMADLVLSLLRPK